MIHTNFFSWWSDRATKITKYQFLVARTENLVAPPKRSEMNGGNIRLHMTLKINVGCLSLVSEMNGGNIWPRMMLNKCQGFAFTVGNEFSRNIRLCKMFF